MCVLQCIFYAFYLSSTVGRDTWQQSEGIGIPNQAKKYGRSARILHYSISSSSPGKPLSVSIASSLRLITFISGLIYVFLIFSPPKINILLPTTRNCKPPWQVQSSRLFFLALKIHTISRCT